MIEVTNSAANNAKMPLISVIGIGGGGNNAVDRMLAAGLENVNFISINTDDQVLERCCAPQKLQIGKKLTGGLGAGADPSVGEASAEEAAEEIANTVAGSKMAILTCGLGGGTGTGAIPVVARICREQKVLTVAVVTLPFSFEGLPKHELAMKGLEALRTNIDMLLIIPNDKLLQVNEKNFYLEDAFIMADNVLKDTIQGITDIIYGTGIINLDYNDIQTTLGNKGLGHLGIGTVKSDESILDAVKQAINSPLLDTDISSATNILLNTSGRINLASLDEAVSYIREITNPAVKILWGTVNNRNSADEITVTLIATGLSDTEPKQKTQTTSEYCITEKPENHSNTVEEATEHRIAINSKADNDMILHIPIFLQKYSTLRKADNQNQKQGLLRH